MKRILAIDGGGIRGLIPAIFCEHLEKETKRRIHTLFDLIAGTSTGSILALAFAKPEGGICASDLVEFYTKEGGKIFANPRGRMRYLRGTKYDNRKLRELLHSKFGDTRISQALTEVVVPAYDLKHRIPTVFSRGSEHDCYMRDACLSSSAAPTYFPPIQIHDKVMADGGLIANNPASFALAKAKELWPDEELILISLGTGILNTPILFESASRWGVMSWGLPLIDCLFDGTAQATHTVLAQLLKPGRYWRFQPGLNERALCLDEASEEAIAMLKNLGQQVWDQARPNLPLFLQCLTENSRDSEEAVKIKRSLNRLGEALSKVIKVQDQSFLSAVHSGFQEFESKLHDWGNGDIRIGPEDGGQFLIGLYRNAKTTVNSTRSKDFSAAFRTNNLAEILNANAASPATVTRVFIFEDIRDITGFDLREMHKQHAKGITVRVLLADGKGSTKDDLKDFTIIDGNALGITEFFEGGKVGARWRFGHSKELEAHSAKFERLVRQSIPYTQLIERIKVRSRLWHDHELAPVTPENVAEYQRLSRKYFRGDAADENKVIEIQAFTGGGIQILRRVTDDGRTSVGIISIVPVSRQGYRRLEKDAVKGNELTSSDLARYDEPTPLAYYLGSVAAENLRARAALIDFLRNAIREFAAKGVESVFARPVTADGLRLLKSLEFKGPAGEVELRLSHVSRLRL